MIENNFGGTTGMLGVPHSYWSDLASRDGVAVAASLGKPVLVLHGDRDYQVTAEDLAIWKQGLARARHVEFATFSGDNHLFIRSTGPPGPPSTSSPATSTSA